MEPTQGAPDPGATGDRPRPVGAGDGSIEPAGVSESTSEGAEPATSESRAPLEDVPRRDPEEAAREDAAFSARVAALRAAEAAAGRTRDGLLAWTALVFGAGLVSLLVRRPDLALFLMFAALFALTQSWDARDRARTGDVFADQSLEPSVLGFALRLLVPALLPAIGVLGFGLFAVWTLTMPHSLAHTAALQWSVGAAVVCATMLLVPVSQLFARAIVRPPSATHTARLTASLAVLALLLPVPVRLVFDELTPLLASGDRALVDVPGLVGQLAGELVFAFAAVGLWVSRTPRETWARLGLGPMGAREWLVALVGLVTVGGLNSALEWLERKWLPDLWKQDQAMGEMITRDMGLGTALVLGVCAGVGEEILVRGALQPRTGLLWASLIFAVAHVQYTWFGMLVVALLGVSLGLVRRYTNTTTAIVVHSAYDVAAVFSMSR